MPIFEYKCESCSNEFETLVLKSNETINCPKCNNPDVHKIMSACSFKSQGGGEVKRSASASGCAGCSASSCASCH